MNTRRQPPKPPSSKHPARFHVTVDVVALTITDGVLKVAVVQRDSKTSCIDQRRNGDVREIPRDSKHHWALSGGHVRYDTENINEAAARELFEETKIEVDPKSLIQLGAYGALGRDPRPGRTVSIAFLAFQPMFSDPIAGTDAKQARFFSVLDLLTEPNRLEFDHETMLLDAIQRVRDMVLITPIATGFCPPTFTMSELREVYEVLWHPAYDKEISDADRQRLAAELRRYENSDEYQLLSSLKNQSARVSKESRTAQPRGLSSGAVYSRIESEFPEFKYQLAQMPQERLNQITKILMTEAKSNVPRKPEIKKRLDPANFARKVEKIPGFIEKISDSELRSSMSGTGRPAQLYRRGDVQRLDPPLRLEVKRGKGKTKWD